MGYYPTGGRLFPTRSPSRRIAEGAPARQRWPHARRHLQPVTPPQKSVTYVLNQKCYLCIDCAPPLLVRTQNEEPRTKNSAPFESLPHRRSAVISSLSLARISSMAESGKTVSSVATLLLLLLVPFTTLVMALARSFCDTSLGGPGGPCGPCGPSGPTGPPDGPWGPSETRAHCLYLDDAFPQRSRAFLNSSFPFVGAKARREGSRPVSHERCRNESISFRSYS